MSTEESGLDDRDFGEFVEGRTPLNVGIMVTLILAVCGTVGLFSIANGGLLFGGFVLFCSVGFAFSLATGMILNEVDDRIQN